jgi:thymidylate kinase
MYSLVPPAGPGLAVDSATEGKTALPLVRQLCLALEAEAVEYCHWKSNNALDRSASGQNDLDLLVSRDHVGRFTEVLHRLQFKQVIAPPERRIPRVIDYYGYDEASDTLVHVHAHYQLVCGHDSTKNYRVPIETEYLRSAVQGALFKVPAPEFEYILLVIRLTLKHSTWDAILSREGGLNTRERHELEWLRARVDSGRVLDLVRQHLPFRPGIFAACTDALHTSCSPWVRAVRAHQLQAQLQAHARRSWPVDTCIKLCRRLAVAIGRRLFRAAPRYQLAAGGTTVAIVGGDGSGKSTVVEALQTSLSGTFETTTVHMGKPAWSWTTVVVRSLLKLGQMIRLYPLESSREETLVQRSPISAGFPWLLREVCLARDRYSTFVKAHRRAARGALVIFDRFPLPHVQSMDGPRTRQFVIQLARESATSRCAPRSSSRIVQWLIAAEESYYRRIGSPDLLVVLRLDPEIAVARKPEEAPSWIRWRAEEIRRANWDKTRAHIVDASASKSAVLRAVTSLLWSHS